MQPVGYHERPVSGILGRTVRAAVWEMTDGRCYYCGVQTNPYRNFTVDHKLPRSRGGDNAIWNLVPACRACNSSKGSRLLITEWMPEGIPWFTTDEIDAYMCRWGDIWNSVVDWSDYEGDEE